MCENRELQLILKKLPKEVVDLIYNDKKDMENIDEKRKYFKKYIFPEIKKRGRKRKRYEFVGKDKIIMWMRELSTNEKTKQEQNAIIEKIYNHVLEFIFINRYSNDIIYNQLYSFLICLINDNCWGNGEIVYEKMVGIPYM